jgi:nitrogen regulatory protein P-II 1
VPKIRPEVLVDDVEAPNIVDVVAAAAGTGKIGDGKVWVTDIEQVVRRRTGEVDDDDAR